MTNTPWSKHWTRPEKNTAWSKHWTKPESSPVSLSSSVTMSIPLSPSPRCNIYLSLPLHFLDNNYSKNKQNHRGRIRIPTFLTSKHRHKKPNTHILDLKASRDMSFGTHSWILVFLSRQRKKTKSRATKHFNRERKKNSTIMFDFC